MRPIGSTLLILLCATAPLIGCSGTAKTSAPAATTKTTQPVPKQPVQTPPTPPSQPPQPPNTATLKTIDQPSTLDGIGAVTWRTWQDPAHNNRPRAWAVIQNNIEKVKLGWDNMYDHAEIKAQDLDGDHQPEVLFYRYNSGSAGTTALNVYRIGSTKWSELLAVDPYKEKVANRYKVRYTGHYQVSFLDNVTGLHATIPLNPATYKDFAKTTPSIDDFLKQRIKDWVDPIATYKLADLDHDGVQEILAEQRVIGISHPDTIAVIRSTYKLQNGSYHLISYTLLQGETENILDQIKVTS